MDNLGGGNAGRVTAAAASQLGGSGGAEAHQMSLGEMPAHTHDYWDIMYCEHSGFDPGVSEVGVPNSIGSSGTDSDNVGFQIQRTSLPAGTANNAAFSTLPPYVGVTYIIKI